MLAQLGFEVECASLHVILLLTSAFAGIFVHFMSNKCDIVNLPFTVADLNHCCLSARLGLSLDLCPPTLGPCPRGTIGSRGSVSWLFADITH